MPEILGASKSISGFDPRSVGSCVLWLDGADSRATSNIATGIWLDKSGNAYNTTSNAGGAFSMGTINGVSAVTFPAASAAALLSSVPLSSTVGLSAFFVASMSANTGNTRFLTSSGGGYLQVYTTTSGLPTQIATYVNAALSTNSSPSVAANTPFMYSSTIGASSFFQWINGVANSVSGATGAFTSTLVIGNYSSPASNAYAFTGQMGEVIIYNSVLTTAQRQAVEGYLAWKWGTETFAPASVPQSISGLKLWLDGTDPAGTGVQPAAGASVTTWVDKSGLGNNGTATGGSPIFTAKAINGTPAIYMSNAPGFRGNISITGTTLTCFAVAVTPSIPNALGHDQRLVSLAVNTAGADYTSVSTAIALMNWAAYDASSIVTYRNLGPIASNAISANVAFIAASEYDGTNGYLWKDGKPGSSPSAGSTGSFATGVYGVGEHATTAGGPECWNGYIGEVLIYSNALTTAQRQSVESYLANKWSITVPTQSLPLVHPYSFIQPLNREFNPVDVPGCILWLDAGDQSTFNGGGAITNGTAITSWRDKSGLSNNATATTTNKPTWSAACNALQFTNTNTNGIAGLLNTTYSNTMTVFIVMAYSFYVPYTDIGYPRFFAVSSNATFPNTANTNNLYGQLNLIREYNGYSNPPYAWSANGNGPNSASGYTYAGVYFPSPSSNTNPTGLYAGTNLAVANAITVSNGSAGPGKPFIYTNASTWDGTNLTLNSFSNDYQAASSKYSGGVGVGSYVGTYNQYAVGNVPGLNAGLGDAYNGFIHEVIAYSNALSSNQIQLVQQYLARRWNIYNATPSNGNTASNFTPSNIIYTASPVMVSPMSVSGCILWLDASDPSTTATSIKDLSASGGSSTSFSGSPTLSNINGVKALAFNGSSYILGGWPVSYGCNITTFTVGTLTSATGNGLFSVGGTATGTLNQMAGTNIYFNYGNSAVMYNNNVYTNLANTFTTGNTTNIMLQSTHSNIPTTGGVPFIQVNRNTFVSNYIAGTAVGQGGSNVCFTELIYNGRSLSNQVAAPEYTGLTYGWGTFYPLSMNVWALGTGLYSSYTNPAPWIGCIGEVIVFSNVLNDTQRNQIEGYLAWKWGIQSRLPTQHPYSRFPPSITGTLAITPGTIATVTLSGLSSSGGTITWTASTNAVGYYWYVGTGAGTGQVATGTVGAVLTTSVTYAFTASTNYYAWVIPFSSTGTNGATTVSAAASYTAGAGYSYSTTVLPWPATTGYTQYTGGYTNTDDGNSTGSATLPVAFSMNATSSTAVFMSTNGFFTLASGNGGIYSSPQQLAGMLAGNPGDNWLQNGLTMSDGDQQYWWYKVASDGSGKYNIKNICFNGTYGNTTSPRSWLGNLYRDSTYQWYETRVKSNTTGSAGPYNAADVSRAASTVSSVWRGDLNGQNWTYMGTGSVI